MKTCTGNVSVQEIGEIYSGESSTSSTRYVVVNGRGYTPQQASSSNAHTHITPGRTRSLTVTLVGRWGFVVWRTAGRGM